MKIKFLVESAFFLGKEGHSLCDVCCCRKISRIAWRETSAILTTIKLEINNVQPMLVEPFFWYTLIQSIDMIAGNTRSSQSIVPKLSEIAKLVMRYCYRLLNVSDGHFIPNFDFFVTLVTRSPLVPMIQLEQICLFWNQLPCRQLSVSRLRYHHWSKWCTADPERLSKIML